MGFNYTNEDLLAIVRPYQFALQAGNSNGEKLLDYSLMMVQVGTPQTIPAPSKGKARTVPPTSRIPLSPPNQPFEFFKPR